MIPPFPHSHWIDLFSHANSRTHNTHARVRSRYDALLSLGGGLTVGWICRKSAKYDFGHALEFICAFAVAVVASALSTLCVG
jgi:hypothetical protein